MLVWPALSWSRTWLTMNITSRANQSDCPEVRVPLPIFFAIGVVSLAENLLVVVAVIRNRNLHSPMYCYICSLAAFNTITSLSKTCENMLIILADYGHLKKRGSSETKMDDVIDCLLCMSFVGSIFSFMAIAVDRYEYMFLFRWRWICCFSFDRVKCIPPQHTNPWEPQLKDIMMLLLFLCLFKSKG